MKASTQIKVIYGYINRELSSHERSEFESQMESDPFLHEAVQGFQTDPAALNDLPKFSSPSFSWFYVLGFVILALGMTVFFFGGYNEPSNTTEIHETEWNMEPTRSFTELTPIQVIVPLIEYKSEEPGPILNEGIDLPDARPVHLDEVAILDYRVPRNQFPFACPSHLTPNLKLPNPKVFYLHNLKVAKPLPHSFEQAVTADKLINNIPANQEIRVNQDSYTKYYESPKGEDAYLSGMEEALRLVSLSEYKEAMHLLQNLSYTYPKDLSLQFYLGLCHYELSNFDRAIACFVAVETHMNPAFSEEAKWYYSLSLLEKEEYIKAKTKLSQIANSNGHYAIDASSRLALLEVKYDL